MPSPFERFTGTDRYLTNEAPRGRGQLRARARAAAAGEGRARHRQDAARRGHRRGARAARSHLAREEHHPRAGRPLRLRHRAAPVRLALRRRRRAATSAATSSSGRWARRSPSTERVVLLIDEVDKADLEFPNDLLHELDRMRFRIIETDDEVVAEAAAGRHHHQQQREGAAGRLPAPLRLPLHRLPGRGADAAHRRRAPPRARRGAGRAGARGLLRAARHHPAAQAPQHQRAHRLDRRAQGRGRRRA